MMSIDGNDKMESKDIRNSDEGSVSLYSRGGERDAYFQESNLVTLSMPLTRQQALVDHMKAYTSEEPESIRGFVVSESLVSIMFKGPLMRSIVDG